MLHNGYTAVLRTSGPRAYRAPNGTVYNYRGGPILHYGTTWYSVINGPAIQCHSYFYGMECESDYTGHGFFLSRQRVRLY